MIFPEDTSQLENFLRFLPSAAYICDADGVITAFNDHAVELWGNTPDSNRIDHRYCAACKLKTLDGQIIEKCNASVALAIEKGEPQKQKGILVRRDGSEVAVQLSCDPLLSKDGSTVGAIAILANISDRLIAEEALRRQTDFSRSIIQTAAEGICVFRRLPKFPFLHFSEWNDRMREITGYSMDEINQVGWYETLFPDDAENARMRCEELHRDGAGVMNYQFKIKRKHGEQRRVQMHSSSMDGTDDSPNVATIQDVTDEYRYKAELQSSEERLKLVMNAGNIGIWDWNCVTDEVFYSGEWNEQLGLPSSPRLGTTRDWENRLHPDDRDSAQSRLNVYLAGDLPNYDAEFRMRHEDGSYRWINARGVASRDDHGQVTRMYGCHIDVTQRRRTENTLRHIVESVVSTSGTEYFRKLASYLCDACDVDYVLVAQCNESQSQARTVVVSNRGKVLSNIEYALPGTPCERMLASARPQIYHGVQDEFPDDQLLIDLDVDSYAGMPLSSSDGKPLGWIALLKQSDFDDPESVISVLHVLGSRTSAELERHLAEQAAQRSEQRVSTIAATVPHALYVISFPTLAMEYYNDFVSRDLGYPEQEVPALIESHRESLWHPEDARQFPDMQQRWREVEDGEVIETHCRLKHSSGEWRWYRLHAAVYERNSDSSVKSIIGTGEDITSQRESEAVRKQLEEQVHRTQRLESLGVLAGGVAHDFNNLLTTITVHADMALLAMPEEASVTEPIGEIIKVSQSLTDLTDQMLAYAGKGRSDLRPTDLSEVIEETRQLLQLSISKRCTLNLELGQNLPHCLADRVQLRQVIMNLLMNASEASSDSSGVISVRTFVEHFDDTLPMSHCAGSRLDVGQYLCLEVEDDGVGMNSETMDRVFDPFFTTKFSGRGLGMSAVAGIVHAHGGAIEIFSDPGQGSRFKIWFPISKTRGESHTRDATTTQPSELCGCILLADDEDSVLASTEKILQHLGFDVISVCDGVEAVKKFTELSGEIDLVMLDLTMPVKDGIDACTEIRSINPEVPVVLTSGYSADTNSKRFESAQVSEFLQKPFRINTLRESLLRCLV